MTLFYEAPQDFRAWIKANHKKGKPTKVGFRTRANGHACIAFEDAQAEAIAFGWCALKRVAIDRNTYAVVFGPRPAKSKWSAGDVALAEGLIAERKMTPSGLAAFEARAFAQTKPAGESGAELSPMMLAEFKRHNSAWASFQKLPEAKRQSSAGWVMGAKQEKTRSARFAKLLMDMSRPRK